jgi:hypothetical protein
MTTWRERLQIHFGPGVLGGITLGDWLRLLRENRFAVDIPYLPKAAAISLAALHNSVFRWFEERRYRRKWEEVSVPPPLFVLGHWRSGTTHLHYLLGLDDRFACPKLYQVHFPHTFLTTEDRFSSLVAFLLPRHRPYDNVRLNLNVPDEDEFAMCVLGFMSPYLTGVFSRRADYYDQFLTLRNTPSQLASQWKSSLLTFFRKLTLRHGKPLIVKSPTHTGRIKLLLEMFPSAKFIHIHRDPYTVFQSTVHTHETGLPFARLQRTDGFDWSGRIIRQYKEMYDAFFEERSLIPPGHFHELRFEDLEHDPVREIRKLYAGLSLPDFSEVEPKLQTYVSSLSDYRKNSFPQLAPEVRQRIASEWGRCFEEWSYPV